MKSCGKTLKKCDGNRHPVSKNLKEDLVQDRLLRPREVAEQLACATSTVYKYIDKGLLAAVKIPAAEGRGKERTRHLVRIKSKDLQLFVDSFHSGS